MSSTAALLHLLGAWLLAAPRYLQHVFRGSPQPRPRKTAYVGANINQKANPVKFPWPIQEIWCLRLSVLLLLALKGYTHPGGQANDGHYGHWDPRGKQQAVFTTQVFCWSNWPRRARPQLELPQEPDMPSFICSSATTRKQAENSPNCHNKKHPSITHTIKPSWILQKQTHTHTHIYIFIHYMEYKYIYTYATWSSIALKMNSLKYPLVGFSWELAGPRTSWY